MACVSVFRAYLHHVFKQTIPGVHIQFISLNNLHLQYHPTKQLLDLEKKRLHNTYTGADPGILERGGPLGHPPHFPKTPRLSATIDLKFRISKIFFFNFLFRFIINLDLKFRISKIFFFNF